VVKYWYCTENGHCYDVRYTSVDKEKKTFTKSAVSGNIWAVGDTLQVKYFEDDPYKAKVIDSRVLFSKREFIGGTIVVSLSILMCSFFWWVKLLTVRQKSNT
jgi:hypothetical protein